METQTTKAVSKNASKTRAMTVTPLRYSTSLHPAIFAIDVATDFIYAVALFCHQRCIQRLSLTDVYSRGRMAMAMDKA